MIDALAYQAKGERGKVSISLESAKASLPPKAEQDGGWVNCLVFEVLRKELEAKLQQKE